MNFVERMKLKSKLMAVMLLPLAALIFFAQAWVVEQLRRLDAIAEVNRAYEVSAQLAGIVHSIQYERDAAALGRDKGEAIRNTDSRIDALKKMLKGRAGTDKETEDALAATVRLSAARGLTDKDMLDSYSTVQQALLGAAGGLHKLSNNAELTGLAASYSNFLMLKEQATAMSAALAAGNIVEASRLASSRRAYEEVFRSFATVQQWGMYSETAGRIKNTTDPEAILAAYKQVEDRISSDLNTRAMQLRRSAQNALVIDFSVTGAALIAVLLFSYLLTKSILRQLGGEPVVIVDALQSIAKGDLTHAMDGGVGLYDEMRLMAARLRKDVSKIIEASEKVRVSSSTIKDNMEELSAGASRQVNASEQVASATTEMSQAVMDIAKNAADISQSADETRNVAKSGSEVVMKTISEVQEIARTVTQSSELMTSLGARSNQIGEIISVINEIADQTNLLALNAAIEAARAGDQGRGFAVVADEVRRLAERTSKSTGEIGEMIGAIQKETALAVKSMQESLHQVELGTGLSGEAGKALQKIVEHVDNLHNLVQQIAASTEEMSATAEMISADISSIAETSQNTNRKASQTNTQSQDLAQLGSDLKEITSHFKV